MNAGAASSARVRARAPGLDLEPVAERARISIVAGPSAVRVARIDVPRRRAASPGRRRPRRWGETRPTRGPAGGPGGASDGASRPVCHANATLARHARQPPEFARFLAKVPDDVRRLRVVAGMVLIALLAAVAVPGSVGSQGPSPATAIDQTLFQGVEVSSTRGTVMTTPCP